MAGEKQTEILSVNGKPSEYRSLNIHHTVSGFVIQVFLWKLVYSSVRFSIGAQIFAASQEQPR